MYNQLGANLGFLQNKSNPYSQTDNSQQFLPSPYNSSPSTGDLFSNPYGQPVSQPMAKHEFLQENQDKIVMDYQKYNNPDQINASSEGFAAEVNPLLAKKKLIHGQALFATIFLAAGQGLLIGLFMAEQTDLQPGYVVGIAMAIYVVYLMIAFCCNPLLSYLNGMSHGGRFRQEYDNVVGMNGIFIFHASCYHFETRHHTRRISIQNGGHRTQHYTTTQKVVTHSASQQLIPRITRDDSGPVDEVNAPTNIIFVDYIIKYKFSDLGSEAYLNQFFRDFRRRHTFDAHQNFSFRYSLPPFKAVKAFYVGELTCKFLNWFYIFGLVGMVWPYSLWVEGQITRFNLEFMKVVTF